MRIIFENRHLYDISYMRNNKTSTTKKLRCYPHCTVAQNKTCHREAGVCGHSVICVISWEKGEVADTTQLKIDGQIRPVGCEGDINEPIYACRVLPPQGEEANTNPNSIRIAFNSNTKPIWSYNWKSSHVKKGICNERHAFVVTVAQPNKAPVVFQGPPFEITSRRRGEVSFPLLYTEKSPAFWVDANAVFDPDSLILLPTAPVEKVPHKRRRV